jgi:hypothetical protein
MVFNPSFTIPNDRDFSVTGILSATTFTTDIGVDSQARTYVGNGTATEYLADLTFGSGYRNPVSVAVTDLSGNGASADITAEVVSNTHVFVSATTNAVSVTGGSPLTPTGATYDPATGNLVITKASHGLTTSDTVGLATN